MGVLVLCRPVRERDARSVQGNILHGAFHETSLVLPPDDETLETAA